MSTFAVVSSFPPSLARMPILAMFTLMGFYAVVALCLQWIYSIFDEARDHPAPLKSYVTTMRRVKLKLLFTALALTLPRLVLVAAWQRLTPWWREGLALSAWVVLIPAAVLMSRAWWLDRRARPTERLHVNSYRYVELAPATVNEKTRGAMILAVIFVIAFATTFVRQVPRDVPSLPAAVERR